MTTAPFSGDWLRGMVRDSLMEPRRAAEALLKVALPADALWTWLALIAVLNGLLYNLAPPGGTDLDLILPAVLRAPLVLTGVVGVVMICMTWVFTAAGRSMGGRGQFYDMLLVTCWLQSLRLIFQAAVEVVANVSLGVAGLMSLVGGIWSLFILASFLTVVHRFPSPLKSVWVMIIAVFGVAFAMTFLLTLMGVQPPEV